VESGGTEPTPAPTGLELSELFVRPVGPRGLEPTAKLLALAGERVRVRGYMARAESPPPGVFILSPLPVELGEADEGLADDLPPAAVFVHVDGADPAAAAFTPGIVEVVGVLETGAREEADGRVSHVRVRLETRSGGFAPGASK
jgi:hypothetical protein